METRQHPEKSKRPKKHAVPIWYGVLLFWHFPAIVNPRLIMRIVEPRPKQSVILLTHSTVLVRLVYQIVAWTQHVNLMLPDILEKLRKPPRTDGDGMRDFGVLGFNRAHGAQRAFKS